VGALSAMARPRGRWLGGRVEPPTIVYCQSWNLHQTDAKTLVVPRTGWAKKVIPLVHYITLYERYHFFGPTCILRRTRVLNETQQGAARDETDILVMLISGCWNYWLLCMYIKITTQNTPEFTIFPIRKHFWEGIAPPYHPHTVSVSIFCWLCDDTFSCIDKTPPCDLVTHR